MNKRIRSLLFFIIIVVLLLPACKTEKTSGTETNDTSNVSNEKNDKSSLLSFLDNKEGNKEKLTAFEELFEDAPKLAWDDNDCAGYIDIHGDWVIEPKYRQARPFSEGFAAVRDPVEGKWGYIDTNGEYVISPRFYAAEDFYEGTAVVASEDYCFVGMIDTKGEYIIQPIYKRVSNYRDGYSLVKDDSGYYFLDEKGNKSFETYGYYEAYSFNNGKALVNVGGPYFNSWHILDTDGNITYFDQASEEGRVVEKIIDTFPFGTNGYYADFNGGLTVETWNGKCLVDDNGNFISPYFAYIDQFNGDYAKAGAWSTEGSIRYGYVDKDFNWVIEPIYWNIFYCTSDYLWAVEEEKSDEPYKADYRWYIVDMHGNRLYELKHDGEITVQQEDAKYMILENKNNLPISALKKYSDEPMDFKCGYIDKNYNEILPFIYESAGSFAYDGSYAIVKYNGHYGMIDIDGNWIIEPKFSSFESRRYNY